MDGSSEVNGANLDVGCCSATSTHCGRRASRSYEVVREFRWFRTEEDSCCMWSSSNPQTLDEVVGGEDELQATSIATGSL